MPDDGQYDQDHIDDVAVERACDGDRTVRLNAAEMAAAVRRCEARGLSASQTGNVLGVAARTVAYVRDGGETTRPRRRAAAAAVRPVDVTFLTVSEVARELRVSKMTIYRLIHAGELRAVQIGKVFRVPGRALNEYLSELGGAA